jgi:hypothetical protein
MTAPLHPLIRRLLDGEVTLAALPPELRAEGAAALRALAALDREPVTLSPALEARVMEAVRRRAAAPRPAWWRWLNRPHELRVEVRPWMLGPALAAAAALALLLGVPGGRPSEPAAARVDSVFVRFVLYAPGARQVALAGSFNEWDPGATPLVRGSEGEVWTTTLALPAGQYQYGFLVDGQRWVADPAAPRLDDGFGRANSLLAVLPSGGTL